MNATERLIDGQLESMARVCVTSSFQAECAVLLHMLVRRVPDIPVLFLETFHHFPEVLEYKNTLAERWKLSLVTLRAATPAPGLWRVDTAACCRTHKIEPLFAALEGYDVWFTALRRDQSPTRAALREVEPFQLPSGRTVSRVSPLAAWTMRDLWTYAKANDIPLLPLYEAGFSSIGCEPCTSKPTDPLNPRSGRWGGQKLECGIHIPASKE